MDIRKFGGSKDVPLIVKFYNNQTYASKDHPNEMGGAYISAELNQTVLPEDQWQKNPYLTTYKYKNANNEEVYKNDRPYSISQLEKIAQAAGQNQCPIVTKEGEQIGTAFSVTADVFTAKDDRGGLVIDTRTVQSNDFPLNQDVLNKQYKTMHAAKEREAAAHAARKPDAAPSQNFFTNFAQGFARRQAAMESQQQAGVPAQQVPMQQPEADMQLG